MSAYLKLMNVHTTERLNVHDTDLFDIIQGPSLWFNYAFHLFLVLDSEYSLGCEAKVDKLYSVLSKSTLIWKSGKLCNFIKVWEISYIRLNLSLKA